MTGVKIIRYGKQPLYCADQSCSSGDRDGLEEILKAAERFYK